MGFLTAKRISYIFKISTWQIERISMTKMDPFYNLLKNFTDKELGTLKEICMAFVMFNFMEH